MATGVLGCFRPASFDLCIFSCLLLAGVPWLVVGGPYWDVPVGRLDSKKASLDLANNDIPTAQQGLLTLIAKFWEKGLDATDMVALVGMLLPPIPLLKPPVFRIPTPA
ncbi:unnamed protein product [Miscanthus lutarioriparius]|uniref:Plant heme peroxidase family profile domain-containing protein n=1 Tax=Miscanthus lutarioriparius TaxID=422564 RepID=A0A811SE43_9POAL|nr:unnamed protein product [Miscanthus lutarioriparius]